MAAQEVIDDSRYEELAHGLAAHELPVEDRPQQLGGGSRDIEARFDLSAGGGGAQDLAKKQPNRNGYAYALVPYRASVSPRNLTTG